MADLTCSRCGMTREAIPYRPFSSELGQRLVEKICNVCWGDWLRLQQQLINHYALNLRDPGAKDFLYGQLDRYLFTSEPQS